MRRRREREEAPAARELGQTDTPEARALYAMLRDAGQLGDQDVADLFLTLAQT